MGNAAEESQRLADTGAQRRRRLIGGESNVARSAVAQRRHEGQQRLAATTDVREVGLQLPSRRGFETNHGVLFDAFVRRDHHLDLRHSTGVAALAQLAM